MGSGRRSVQALQMAPSSRPSCIIRSGFRSLQPDMLSSWAAGDMVWSDREYRYTDMGSFTNDDGFAFKVLTSVELRKATFSFSAPLGFVFEIFVLGETRAVAAPWAFLAGEPDLDDSWCEEPSLVLPQYEAGGTYQYDFCRCRELVGGETLCFVAHAGGKVDLFIKVMKQPLLQPRPSEEELREATHKPALPASGGLGELSLSRLMCCGACVKAAVKPVAKLAVMSGSYTVKAAASKWASSEGSATPTEDLSPCRVNRQTASSFDGSAEVWELNDDLPAAANFLPLGNSGWCAHPTVRVWLVKPAVGAIFHMPSSTLWKRANRVLIRHEQWLREMLLSTTPQFLIRATFGAWQQFRSDAKQWHDSIMDFANDDLASRPVLRKGPKGIRKPRRGVTPPPRSGWERVGHGWSRAGNWLKKKTSDCDGPVYFYVPTETLWHQGVDGSFVCLQTYQAALASLIFKDQQGLQRVVMQSWRNQVLVVQAWRQRIRILTSVTPSFCIEEKKPGQTSSDEASPLRHFQTMSSVGSSQSQGVDAMLAGLPVRAAFRGQSAEPAECNPRRMGSEPILEGMGVAAARRGPNSVRRRSDSRDLPHI